jgi:multidrug efflux pump subunit AcrA (membrane-fusion protein)
MRKIAFLTAAVLLTSGIVFAQRPNNAGSSVTVDNCVIRPLTEGEARLAAQEPGVLAELNVKEGQLVPAGTLLAKIDDAQPQAARKVALAEMHSAEEKYANDVEIRHADKAASVAEFEYRVNEQAAKKVPGSVADVDIKRLFFQWEKSKLAKEQAEKERILNGFAAEGKRAEVENAEETIKRRQIRAQFEGVVQQIYPHVGEWVKSGDTVLRLIRMDRLRVEGLVNKNEFSPSDVSEQPVVVQAIFANGRKADFAGKIVFVDVEVNSSGSYKVRAEVDNRRENGQWMLRPGLPDTSMTIQLHSPAGIQAADSRK